MLLFAIGWFITPLQAAVVTIFQTGVPDAGRGRAMATLQAAMSGASVVSMALAGVFGDLAGVRNVFMLAGVVVFIGGVAAAVLYRGTGPATIMTPLRPPSPAPPSTRRAPPSRPSRARNRMARRWGAGPFERIASGSAGAHLRGGEVEVADEGVVVPPRRVRDPARPDIRASASDANVKSRVPVHAGSALKIWPIVRFVVSSARMIDDALSMPLAKTARAPARRKPAPKLSTRFLAVALVGLARPHSELPDA